MIANGLLLAFDSWVRRRKKDWEELRALYLKDHKYAEEGYFEIVEVLRYRKVDEVTKNWRRKLNSGWVYIKKNVSVQKK